MFGKLGRICLLCAEPSARTSPQQELRLVILVQELFLDGGLRADREQSNLERTLSCISGAGRQTSSSGAAEGGAVGINELFVCAIICADCLA